MPDNILPPRPVKAPLELQNVPYVRYAIFGNDIFSLAVWYDLVFKQKVDAQLFCWQASPQRMDDWFWQGPSWLRGQVNLNVLRELYPAVNFKAFQDPLFYKETQWRSFHSRMKPQPLLGEEAYFTAAGYDFAWGDLYPFWQEDKVLEHASIQNKIPLAIQPLKASDEVSPAWWQLEFSDGSVVQCQDLIWGGSKGEFKKLLNDGERTLADQVIRHCLQAEELAIWSLRFSLDPLPELMRNTFFIPLSYTYDEGHFIGEITHTETSTLLRVMRILKPQDATEEQAAKDHRYLKRILQKIFSLSKKQLMREQMQLKLLDPAPVDDQGGAIYDLMAQDHLRMVGMAAALPPACLAHPAVAYIARGVLSTRAVLAQIEKNTQASLQDVPAEEKEIFTDSVL